VILLTELEKLQKAAELIETMTDGNQRFDTVNGTPQIFSERRMGARERYPSVTIRMTRAPLAGGERYRVGFRAHLDTAGPGMDADALHGFAREIQKAQALLTALETQTFTPAKSDLAQFADRITRRETQETIQEESIGPVMGRQGGAL
jgi:hypothetical protein